MNKGAHFSDDRKYRYALWRIWNDDKPLVMFIGLNPSTAAEQEDDPTIRRVIRFAYNHGFGGFYMMNLFAYVTPFPSYLQSDEARQHEENERWLAEISPKCESICFAWGGFAEPKHRTAIRERAEAVKARFPAAFCLGRTKQGHPAHPLYLPADRKMIPFITIS